MGLGFAACTNEGGRANEGAAQPAEDGSVLVLESGVPEIFFGETGDVCLVADTGELYRKTESGWTAAECESYEIAENRLTVTYADGTVEAYTMSEGEASECAHDNLGEPVTVYEPLCVVPGIGVRTCPDCKESFPVILPATGEHSYEAGGYTCLVCGETNYFKDAELENGRYVIEDMRDVPFGDDGELVIPGEINGREVVIGEKAFGSFSEGNNETLKSVVIGEGVKEIRGHAFQKCTELESVVFPESLTILGADPNGGALTTNYYSVFEGCTSLKSVTFKGNVTVIGNRTFYDCSSLSSIELPDSLTTIGQEAFVGTGLESITLPANIKLGGLVFSSCSKLTNVTFKGLVNSTGSKSHPCIPSSCFTKCTSLANIILPEGIEEIGNTAFKDCSALTGIVIPASVTAIGDNAFQNCAELASLTFANGSKLNSIGRDAFSRYGGTGNKLRSVILPEGLETIGGNAFSYSKSLEWVVLPSTLKTFKGNYAFDDCDSLEHLFYNGDSEAWSSIGAGSEATAKVCFFSKESQPNCWYWDGEVPTLWE